MSKIVFTIVIHLFVDFVRLFLVDIEVPCKDI